MGSLGILSVLTSSTERPSMAVERAKNMDCQKPISLGCLLGFHTAVDPSLACFVSYD